MCKKHAQDLPEIRFVCLALADEYIDAHFDDIRNHGSDIENRLDDSCCTADWTKTENQKWALLQILLCRHYGRHRRLFGERQNGLDCR